jgi:ADP-ribose pyrophosphatase YjhB (NUDIX family)
VHHIQRKILYKLLYSSELGYAQMRPPGVESNHFAYHLEQLLQAGLLQKDGRRYSLTTSGLALADRVSHKSMTVRVQPHIVTSIYITNDAGQTLLYKHAFQPYLNLSGPPQGRLHYEEHVADAATRELAEKTGLVGIPLTHRGIAYIHATRQDADISKILTHVFSGTVNGTPELSGQSPNGFCSWANAARLPKAKCMPGFKEVQKLLLTDQFFFTEIETKMAS